MTFHGIFKRDFQSGVNQSVMMVKESKRIKQWQSPKMPKVSIQMVSKRQRPSNQWQWSVKRATAANYQVLFFMLLIHLFCFHRFESSRKPPAAKKQHISDCCSSVRRRFRPHFLLRVPLNAQDVNPARNLP